MTEKIVQATYDLKDNITGKLKNIGDALQDNKVDAEKAASGIERANKRTSDSFAGVAGGVGELRAALATLAGFVGLEKLKEGLLGILEIGEKFDDLEKQFATAFGGLDAGKQAMADIKDFGATVPKSLEDVAAAAIKLRQYGFNPLGGSLQALIDNNLALDGSQEDLVATIDVLGKAYVKGGLNLKSLVALTEQGVPAFDLLAKAMGTSTDRIRLLADQGKLGQDAVRTLVQALGELRAGAAADEMGDLDAQLVKIKDTADEFFASIAASGALDFFRQKLADVNVAVREMAESGELQGIAEGVSSAIVSTASAIGSTTKFLYDHSAALLVLGKAYAGTKLAGFLADLAKVASGSLNTAAALKASAVEAGAAGGKFGGLGAAIRSVPTNIKIGIATVGLDFTLGKLTELVNVIGEYNEAQRHAKEIDADLAASKERLAAKIAEMKQANADFAQASILSSDELRQKGVDQIKSYEDQLQGAVRFYTAIRTEAKLAGDAAGMREAQAHLKELQSALQSAQQAALDVAAGLRDKVSPGALEVARQFAGATQSAAGVTDQLRELFKAFDQLDFTRVGDIGLGLVQVAKGSDQAATSVREGLGKALRDLSGEDLLKFQSSSQAAFDQFKVSSKDSSVVLDATLLAAMEKLGVSPTKFGIGITEAGRNAIAAFQAIAENANATAAQIEASFKSAIANATSKEELEQLGNSLKAAVDQGRIGLEQAEIAALSLQNRLRELAAQADPLADQFAQLGIKSQAALEAARDSAEASFNAIVDGAARGAAATEDVRRAFVAYAQAAIAAAKDSDAVTRDQVESQLRVKAAVFGVTDALQQLGLAGSGAGDQVAGSADRAARSLDNLARNADDAADSAGDLARAGDHAADNLDRIGNSASNAAIGIGSVSKAFLDAAASGGKLDRIEFGKLAAQRQQADAYLAQLEQQIAGTDELAARVERLRGQYNYLGDDQIRALAEKEQQLEEFQRRKEEQLQRERDDLRREQQQGGGSGSDGGSGSGGISNNVNARVEILHKFDGLPAGANTTAIEQMVQAALAKTGMTPEGVAAMLMDQLRHAKARA